MEVFFWGLKNEFETAMVNEPSVFEPLKFYCILYFVILSGNLHPKIRRNLQAWPVIKQYTFSLRSCHHFSAECHVLLPSQTREIGYIFTVSVHVSVHPSFRSTYLRTLFSFYNSNIYQQIQFKFCICICTKNVSLGIVNGLIDKYHRVIALFNV